MSFPSSSIGMLSGILFLGIAAWWNWRTTKVPNALLALFLLAFFPVAWLSGISFEDVALRCTVFAATLLAFLILFSLQIIGAGTAKLVAVTVLWLPLPAGLAFLIICATLACLLALAMRFGEARWLGVAADNFATIAAVVGISLLATAA